MKCWRDAWELPFRVLRFDCRMAFTFLRPLPCDEYSQPPVHCHRSISAAEPGHPASHRLLQALTEKMGSSGRPREPARVATHHRHHDGHEKRA